MALLSRANPKCANKGAVLQNKLTQHNNNNNNLVSHLAFPGTKSASPLRLLLIYTLADVT